MNTGIAQPPPHPAASRSGKPASEPESAAGRRDHEQPLRDLSTLQSESTYYASWPSRNEVRIVSRSPHAGGEGLRMRRPPQPTAALQMIIAAAGGAAHLPGMVAALLRPARCWGAGHKCAAQWSGCAPVHRSDAARRSGRHASNRRRWCKATRPCWRRRSSPLRRGARAAAARLSPGAAR